jgi:hypothetical protein
MMSRYFTVTTMMSDHTIKEAAPSKFAGSIGAPCPLSREKHSRNA